MSGKNNAAYINDYLEPYHLTLEVDVGKPGLCSERLSLLHQISLDIHVVVLVFQGHFIQQDATDEAKFNPLKVFFSTLFSNIFLFL